MSIIMYGAQKKEIRLRATANSQGEIVTRSGPVMPSGPSVM